MDHCLIADPLPSRTPQLDLIDPDYRVFIQLETASLRIKKDQDAAPLMTSILDKFLGDGWQTEYTAAGLRWTDVVLPLRPGGSRRSRQRSPAAPGL